MMYIKREETCLLRFKLRRGRKQIIARFVVRRCFVALMTRGTRGRVCKGSNRGGFQGAHRSRAARDQQQARLCSRLEQ